MGHYDISNPLPDRDGPTFTVRGVTLTGESWHEQFACLPEAPGGSLLDMATSVTTDGEGSTIFLRDPVINFLRAVLVEADVRRFDAMIRNKDRLVRLETLVNIMQAITPDLTGRPTGPLSTSAVGQRETVPSTADGSRSPVSTIDGPPSSFS